jgi:hypothetical protein
VILNKQPGNANTTNNANATVFYGWEQARDSMIRKRSPSSRISDNLKLSLRMLAMPTGLLVMLPNSDLIHTQVNLRHASVKTSLFMNQIFVLMTVKIASALVM